MLCTRLVRGSYRLLGFLLLLFFLVLLVQRLHGALLQLRAFVLGNEVRLVLLQRGMNPVAQIVVDRAGVLKSPR